jgi:DENN domain-containing protein 1
LKHILLKIPTQVKEGGRGMKTAYEGLKSRFRESSASSSSKYDHGATSFATNNGHHSSAPSSPVNPRRAQTMFIPESSYIRPVKPLQSSMSAVNKTFALQHKNHNNNNNNNNNFIKHQDVSQSPAGSPASSSSNSASNSSSDMNILQELQQQNVLFTSPAIDRSVSIVVIETLSNKLIEFIVFLCFFYCCFFGD